jgi:hypothetical protein
LKCWRRWVIARRDQAWCPLCRNHDFEQIDLELLRIDRARLDVIRLLMEETERTTYSSSPAVRTAPTAAAGTALPQLPGHWPLHPSGLVPSAVTTVRFHNSERRHTLDYPEPQAASGLASVSGNLTGNRRALVNPQHQTASRAPASEPMRLGQTPTAGRGQSPAMGLGQTPTAGRGQSPAMGLGQTPTAGLLGQSRQSLTARSGQSRQSPTAGRGQSPAMGLRQTPTAGHGQPPAMGLGQTPTAGHGQPLAMGLGLTPTAGHGQSPAMGLGRLRLRAMESHPRWALGRLLLRAMYSHPRWALG